ncbi:MAG: hypothetical protein HZC37_22055 [Burkholderiales bacterium]|nr:hypothetical protein [Burkholderiales bacterium]
MKVAVHSKGFFKDVGGGAWTESGADGKVAFRFRETRRTEQAVFLLDEPRKVALELNTKDRMVYLLKSSTSRRQHVAITSVRLGAKQGDYFVVRSASQCLQAVFLEDGNKGKVSPELMPCDDSPGQHWNIVPSRDIGGVGPTWQWRNLLTQMAGLDVCLSGTFANGEATMAPCDDSNDGQRWIHAPLSATMALTGLRTPAVQGSVCLGFKHFTGRRYRQQGGAVKEDTEFWTGQMLFCGGPNDANATSNPRFQFALRQ